MGARGREVVRENFLMTRYLEQYLDLFKAFETIYRLNYGFVAGTGDAGRQ